MTQKYYHVRREIYEVNPLNKSKSTRKLSDLRKLCKLPFWIIAITMILSLIAMVVLMIFKPTSLLPLLPVLPIGVALIILERLKEKHLFNETYRNEELIEEKNNYQVSIDGVHGILKKNNINTFEKFLLLKSECETIVKNQKEKQIKVRSKIYSMLIGVPIATLIANIINKSKDLNLNTIILVMFLGAVLSGFVFLLQYILFYLNGEFKDKLMLDSLNELNYSSEIFDKPKTFDTPKIHVSVTMGKS